MATNLLLGVKDAVVGTVDGLIDGIKYVWNNPLQTIEGVNFFSRALHSGTEENDLLVQMIKESGKELSKEFIEGDADKKARMLGQAVGEVLLALVSTKGVTAAVDAIKAGIKSGELASWFSKFSKGTATAEDIANGLGKTAETVDKADDSVKIIGNIDNLGDLSKRDQLLNSVQNDKLKNAINEIYRPGATVGDGGLADAVRHELSTGELVGGKSHIQKATERVTNLENIIKNQPLNQSDLDIATKLLNDLKNALGGN